MSETLRDLVVSLSLNSDNFTRNIKSINKQIQEAESAFRLASAGVENFETTTAGLSSKLSTLQRTFQLQQDAAGQYERALQQVSDKLQECYTRQNDYAQRLADAKDKQLQLKTEVASAAQAYKHYKNTLGETDSATIAAKANLDAYKGEYRAAVQEVKKLEGQNVALKKSTQNAADAFSAAQTKLNGAKGAVKETAAEIDQCSRQLTLSRTSWSSAGEAIQDSQRSIASIESPSKRVKPTGEYVAAGVGEGMSGYDFAADAQDAASGIESALQTALTGESLKNAGTAAAQGLSSAMAAYPMTDTGHSLATNVRSAVQSNLNGNTLRSAGINVMAGLRAGILAGRSGVISAMRSAAREAVNAAKKELKIKSPSQVFRDEVGTMVMRGFGAGVLKESKEQAKIIRNASRFLTGEAREGTIFQSSSDNRRTYNNNVSSTIQVQQMVVRDEQDIRSLAVEIATLTRRQQRGKGLRMA